MKRDTDLRWRLQVGENARRAVSSAVLFVLVFLSFGCHGLPMSWVSQIVLRRIRAEAEKAGFDASRTSNPRIYLYEYELGPGWAATSADLAELETEDPLVCKNRCWLFFVDFMPKAHFAHPTAIVLYDLERNSLELRLASWWPVLTGPRDERPTAVFSTFAHRESQEDIVFPLSSGGSLPSVPEPIPDHVPRRYHFVVPMMEPADGEGPDPEDRSTVWALLVQGCSDMTDNFSDDISRSAAVMDGLRVPSSNVKVVKPLGSAVPGMSCSDSLDLAVSVLLSEMEQEGKECEEFILYVSSHGDSSGRLFCSYNVHDPVQYWEGDEIAQTLKNFGPDSYPSVDCDKVTVVLESCYAGSLEAAVNSGLGEVPHAIVTSADAVSESYTDIDDDIERGIDDVNEGDVGTEFSSGFWEAYGRELADGIDESTKDLDVDLQEAFTYAKEFDITNTLYGTNPQLRVVPAAGIEPKSLVRTIENLTGLERAAPLITGVTLDNDSGLAGKIVIPDTNRISVDIDNTSDHYAPVVTVRIILKADDSVEREVGRTELVAGLGPFPDITSVVEWRLQESFPIDDYTDLCAVADSPSVGSGNASEFCLGNLPVVHNEPPPEPVCFLFGCTH